MNCLLCGHKMSSLNPNKHCFNETCTQKHDSLISRFDFLYERIVYLKNQKPSTNKKPFERKKIMNARNGNIRDYRREARKIRNKLRIPKDTYTRLDK